MHCACVIGTSNSWDIYLSTKVVPFKDLYDNKSRMMLCWYKAGKVQMTGPEMVLDAIRKAKVIRGWLLVARSRRKDYTDRCRKPLESAVAARVMLKGSPWRGTIQFVKRGTLSPRFNRPFMITHRIGKVAYKLELLKELCGIHPVFHVSRLRKCLSDGRLQGDSRSQGSHASKRWRSFEVLIRDRFYERVAIVRHTYKKEIKFESLSYRPVEIMTRTCVMADMI